MNDRTLPASGKHDDLIASLQERAKELNCLYQVEEILNKPDLPLEEVFQSVVRSLGPGWQFPEICEAEIVYQDIVHRSREFQPGPWFLRTDIHVHGQVIGSVAVYYLEERPEEDVGPFLKEEERLIKTVAERLARSMIASGG